MNEVKVFEPLLVMDRRVIGGVKWTAAGALEAPRLKDGATFFSIHQVEAYADAKVQALRDALQEVVDAADGAGWDQLDPGLEKQRAALAALEKQK